MPEFSIFEEIVHLLAPIGPHAQYARPWARTPSTPYTLCRSDVAMTTPARNPNPTDESTPRAMQLEAAPTMAIITAYLVLTRCQPGKGQPATPPFSTWSPRLDPPTIPGSPEGTRLGSPFAFSLQQLNADHPPPGIPEIHRRWTPMDALRPTAPATKRPSCRLYLTADATRSRSIPLSPTRSTPSHRTAWSQIFYHAGCNPDVSSPVASLSSAATPVHQDSRLPDAPWYLTP